MGVFQSNERRLPMNSQNKQRNSIQYYTRLTSSAIYNLQSKDGSAFSLDINTDTNKVAVSFEEDASMLIMVKYGAADRIGMHCLKMASLCAVELMVREYFKVMNGDYL